MFTQIIKELRNHAPFTTFGTITGIVVMVLLKNLPQVISFNIFYILHPLHVLLSSLVTTAIYKLYIGNKYKIWKILLIGYTGSVGIATLSDSLIPYLGEALLNLPNKGIHLGFIEKWWLINPLALAGIAIAFFKPTTKFPHSGHVLLSTWASLFHILMALGQILYWYTYIVVLIFLFLAVWIPCCISDIVFPLLFVKQTRLRRS